MVTPDLILEGTYFCFDDYTVTVTGLLGVPNYGDKVTGANIGQTLKATVTHLVSNNTCWGNIFGESNCPACIGMLPGNRQYGITNYQPDYLKNVLKINEAYPGSHGKLRHLRFEFYRRLFRSALRRLVQRRAEPERLRASCLDRHG